MRKGGETKKTNRFSMISRFTDGFGIQRDGLGILLFYFTLHIFVTKRILKMQKYLHTYIERFKLLDIKKLLNVGNLHLPTFTYIQYFDRTFLNDFCNFST